MLVHLAQQRTDSEVRDMMHAPETLEEALRRVQQRVCSFFLSSGPSSLSCLYQPFLSLPYSLVNSTGRGQEVKCEVGCSRAVFHMQARIVGRKAEPWQSMSMHCVCDVGRQAERRRR